jgi:maltose alpha-D-glucosyltransferase/alpha-amylase
MQWTDERNGGFSRADKTVLPLVDDPIYGFQKVNVNAQRRDPQSFMNWTARLIRVRKECPEIYWGKCEVMDTNASPVLVLSYHFRNAEMITLHNFSDAAQTPRIRLKSTKGHRLVDLLGEAHSDADNRGLHEIALDGYGYRWYRLGVADETLTRATF